MPYSKRACLNASTLLGLQLGDVGKDFIGDYPIEGCHAKGGVAFFGNKINSLKLRTTLVLPHFRPNGFDCGTFVTD